jgi:hypothetical protein
MCNYDEMFARGKSGEPVNFDFCDALNKHQMQVRHKEGLKIFCTKDNGYPYGKSGKEYKNVCTPEQEKAFMPTYYSGRKDFLNAKIQTLRDSVGDKQGEYSRLSASEGRLSLQVSMLPHTKDCRTFTEFNHVTQKNELKTECSESIHVKNQRDMLNRELTGVRSQMRDLRAKIDTTVKELESTQNELNKIPQ